MCSQIRPTWLYFTSIGFTSPHFCYRRSHINLHCSKLLQNIKIKILCEIILYTRKILRSRAIMCFDTSAILNLSLQGQGCKGLVQVFTVHPILTGASMFKEHARTKICCILLIWYSSSRNSWIWCTTQVLSAFFNTCQIDQYFSYILHLHGHHQCHVVRSCFI